MSELTAAEQQFFESGGETALEESAPVEPAVETHAEPAAATPEPVPAAEPAAPKMVPLEALHEARAQTKELRAQLAKLAQERAQFEEFRKSVEARLNPQPQPPAFDENPAEHLRAEVTQTKAELDRLKAERDQQAREHQFSTWYQTQAAQFAQSTPDFMPTYDAFIRGRAGELESQGLAPQQIALKIRQEEQLLAATAAQLGVNPAQMVYQAAIAKGYKPAPAAQAAPDANEAVTNADKLAKVAEGVKSSKSLSNLPGKAPEALTLEYIANMPESEFRKLDWESTMSRLSA